MPHKELLKHIEERHPLCRFCKELYFTQEELYNHMRIAHFTCHVCERSDHYNHFNEPEAFLQHLRCTGWLARHSQVCSLDSSLPRFTGTAGCKAMVQGPERLLCRVLSSTAFGLIQIMKHKCTPAAQCCCHLTLASHHSMTFLSPEGDAGVPLFFRGPPYTKYALQVGSLGKMGSCLEVVMNECMA